MAQKIHRLVYTNNISYFQPQMEADKASFDHLPQRNMHLLIKMYKM